MQLRLTICHPWVCSVTSVHSGSGDVIGGGGGGGIGRGLGAGELGLGGSSGGKGGGNGKSSQHPVQSQGPTPPSPSRNDFISEHLSPVSAHCEQVFWVPWAPTRHSVEHWAGRAGGGGDGGGGKSSDCS